MSKIELSDFTDIIGMSEAEADAFATGKGARIRVVKKDGKHLVITCDLRGDRINVATIGGKIVSIESVG